MTPHRFFAPVGQGTLRLHDEFAHNIGNLLRILIEESNIKMHSITARAKDVESIRRKLQKKLDKEEECDDDSLDEAHPLHIDDLAGARVLLYFKSDIQRVIDLLRREFHVIDEIDVRKRYPNCHGSLGYCCRHFVVSLNDRRRHFAEYSRFRNLRCEVQITTLLEHAWSEVEHDLYYKNKQNEYGDELTHLEREFSAIADFLRHADERIDQLGVQTNGKVHKKNHSGFLDTVRRMREGVFSFGETAQEE